MNAPSPTEKPPIVQRDPTIWIYGGALLVLAGAVGWLVFNPAAPPTSMADQTWEQRLARLEQRPANAVTPPPDLTPLETRLARLENRSVPNAAPANLAPLESRLAALEQRQVPDVGPMESRLTALEQRPAIDAGAISARLDTVAGRQDALSGRAQAMENTLNARTEAIEGRLAAMANATARIQALESRIDTMERRLAATEATAGQVPAIAARAARLARLQTALTALEQGKALGDIPDAPAALARFATTSPPTEAALRLAFADAARAAREAAAPAPSDAPLIERAWTRAQSLVTVRQGDRVVIGDPAAAVLARARRTLEAGDLAGAVVVLGELQGPARAAMAPWLEQAQSLLDARAALAALAATR